MMSTAKSGPAQKDSATVRMEPLELDGAFEEPDVRKCTDQEGYNSSQ
jgi:hypothetical protein